MAQEVKPGVLENIQLRSQFKILQLANPNYFGNLKGSKQPSVQLIAGNTFYEELKCVSYKPLEKLLNAAIVVKQGSGYSGGPCTNGSYEYVRFYVDYLRNGTWIDEGVASTNVHDNSFEEDLCYNVQLKLDPKKLACCDDDAILPKVRAILSWNGTPPPNWPDWTPVWGNVLETNIQIAPNKSFWCILKNGIKLDEKINTKFLENLGKIKYPIPIPDPGPDPELLSPQYFKASYKGKVEDSRIVFKQISDLSGLAEVANSSILKLQDFNLAEILENINKLKFNTTYEEVKCVALNRELNSLHASVVIKNDTGYLGGLCKKGSKEYVAFYMDFGSGYQYMGTSSISVHDIPTIPKGGLWYNISHPVNLEPYQKEWCKVGKAKLKAILSWNVVPPSNNPNYIAPWGDWEECHVEVKPLPKGVVPGETKVILEKVGGMIVADINDATGLATSSFAFSLPGALNSPFHGVIELIGHIFFPVPGMSYRFLLTKPGGVELPLIDTQIIPIDTLGVPGEIIVNPIPDGWITYPQSPTVNIVGGLLGRFGAYEAGKYTVRIEARDGMVMYNDPFGAVTIMADIHAPAVSVHIDPAIGGDCADFAKDTPITGSYTMFDDYADRFTISVTPDNGATVNVDGTGSNSLSYGAGTLPNAGKAGTFVINTVGVKKCGYNVRIDAWDRTIINSHTIGHYSADVQGFCLRG